jgi:hypothetical protein
MAAALVSEPVRQGRPSVNLPVGMLHHIPLFQLSATSTAVGLIVRESRAKSKPPQLDSPSIKGIEVTQAGFKGLPPLTGRASMAKYILLALNGPTAGKGDEETYNRWYDEVHVPDLLAISGITSARRFKVLKSSTPWPYVAAYEIETDDLQAVLAEMETKPRPFDPTFDRSGSGHIVAIAA